MRIQKILFAGLLLLGSSGIANAETNVERTRPGSMLQHDDTSAVTDEREPASQDATEKQSDGFQANDSRQVYHTRDWH